MWPIATARRSRSLVIIASLIACAGAASPVAAQPAGQDSPLVKLLKSGRVPEERLGTIVETIGGRGTATDLAFLYQQALRPGGFPEAVRLKALDALAEAASNRQVRPEVDHEGLGRLIEPNAAGTDPALRLAAIRLAGLWKAEALGDELRSIALSPDAADPLRVAALDALTALGGERARATIEALDAGDRTPSVRALAVAALVKLDAAAAADRAVAVMRDAAKGQDLTPLMAAFLNRQEGSDKLADAIAKHGLPADPAKLALRAVYALGRADAKLVAELSRAAGIDAEIKPLGQPELDRLIADVTTQGDPARGEAVFRRADVNCMSCHAVGGAAGGVGPDLAAVGSSSPVDYLINSIDQPDQAIKEEFQTLVVLTTDGQVFQGIVVDRDDRRLVLREATGDRRVIPASDIEDSREGGSLMPKGLGALMTRQEFVDLVRFLSELGKPGPFAIRSNQTIQRWRVLKPVPEELARSLPDAEAFSDQVLRAEAARWLPAYAKVDGNLPLDELVAATDSKVLYLQGEIDVTAGGKVAFRITPSGGMNAWVDDRPAPVGKEFTTELSPGRHKLTLRVDTGQLDTRLLAVELLRAEGSPAEFTAVGGR